MSTLSINGFIDELASKAPVPGGGGASALIGAIGMALGSMVGSLTLGKKKYADVQTDIEALLAAAKGLQDKLLDLIHRDAEVFEPLSKAYGLPKETEEQAAHKQKVMEEALRLACTVPLDIMAAAAQSIDLHEEFAKKGNKLAISDAGVGALASKSALMGAALNIYINTGSMKDREFAAGLDEQADRLIEVYGAKADAIYGMVLNQIRG